MKDVREAVIKKYNLDWENLPVSERALQVARYFADDKKVKEVGANRGFWVEKFLNAVGLVGGYAWCAAFVTYCLRTAGWKEKFKGMASVRNWYQWAVKNKRLLSQPKRGCLFGWLRKDGTGHIGFVAEVFQKDSKLAIRTIEGNTSLIGSREGDGVYRLSRVIGKDFFFIEII